MKAFEFRHRLAWILSALLLVTGCASTESFEDTRYEKDLEELARLMTGWFDSADQASRPWPSRS